MAFQLSAVLRQLASVLDEEALERIQSAATPDERTRAIVATLPQIQTALKTMPEAEQQALIATVADSEAQQQTAGVMMRILVSSDAEDLQTVATSAVQVMMTQGPSPEAGGGSEMSPMGALSDPETLSALHRVVVKLPNDVKSDIQPMLPEPARPLIAMASDLETDEFVEIASEFVEAVDPSAASHQQQPDPPPPSSSSASYKPYYDDGPSSLSAASAAHSTAGSAAGVAAAAALGTGLDFGAIGRTATTLGKSQLRLQLTFVRSHLLALLRQSAPADGDYQAITLAAGAVGLVIGLIGVFGKLFTLRLISLPLSLCLLITSCAIVLLEAVGATAATLSKAILDRLPALRTAGGRAALSFAAGYTGLLAGPALFSALSSGPLLLSAALNLHAHAASQRPLARLRRELGAAAAADHDGDMAAAAEVLFLSADSEREGSLKGAALSLLSAGFLPGDAALLRGATVALCPLGGHAVTKDGLIGWASEEGASGQDEEGGDVSPPPPSLAPTFYGEAREAAVAGGPDDMGPQVGEALKAGPPAGGWEAQRGSAALAVASALVGTAALLSAVQSLVGFDVMRLAAAAIALLVSGVASIELSQLPSPVGPIARQYALPLLRGCPPLSLVATRAVVLIVNAAALDLSLRAPKGSGGEANGGGGGGLAGLGRLLSLLSMGLAVAAVVLSWRLLFALHFTLDAAKLRRAVARSSAGKNKAGQEEVLALLRGSSDYTQVEACVSLDLDRDGEIGEEDLRAFYGRQGRDQ